VRREVVGPAAPSGAAAGPTLLGLWTDHWQHDTDRPVLVDGTGGVPAFTAAQLAEATAGAAAALAASGLATGDRVLWSCTASLPSIVALVGAMRLGAVVVPVSPSSTRNELAFVIGDAQPSVALVERAEQLEWIASCGTAGGVGALLVDGMRPGTPRPGVALDRALPDDDALIVYTSGTTGTPKGAVHTHRSLLAGVQCLLEAWEWRPADRLILALPLFHVHGLCAGLYGTLAAGGSALVLPRFSEELVLEAASGCTMFFGVPTMYHRLAMTGDAGRLASLRLCVSGSAPLAADLWQELSGHGVDVLERYGMTETLLTLSNPLAGERRPGSVGVPLPGVEAAIDDPDAEGVGELVVRSPSLCRGYWQRPDATSAMGRDGWFATGDLASVAPDGYVTIRGRMSDMIITGGHNVYPAEVEAVLARHPSVAEVAVVGVPSAEWGESVMACVVGSGGHPDIDALRTLAAEELAPFKRPREFTVMDALPRNAMGKVVRRHLG
jgi:malonyl-CoA/methylmalonyl-CoA synthetase